ncbi:MAG: hypothetical protein KIS67_14710 [Verrucomicrobiae bacterium]|nr:hypothetical protein [Verrucomicrobiae bacterium]
MKLTREPDTQTIQGYCPCHTDRSITDPGGSWHSARGVRAEAMLFGAGRVDSFKFAIGTAPSWSDPPDIDYLWS